MAQHLRVQHSVVLSLRNGKTSVKGLLKRCSRCSLDKSRLDSFYQYRGRPKGECKSCTKALSTQRQQRLGRYPVAPEVRKRQYAAQKARSHDGRTEASFLQKFSRRGLTLDQYHAMAERQDFLCALCGEEPPQQNDRRGNVDDFVTDHDHQTQRVRGLTCWSCNSGLGSFRDDPDMLRKAVAYLELHHAQQ